MDLLGEIEAAQRTLCLNFEPLNATFLMEVMLFIAGENNYLVIRAEGNQTDCAIRHIGILFLILLMAHMLETTNVTFK